MKFKAFLVGLGIMGLVNISLAQDNGSDAPSVKIIGQAAQELFQLIRLNPNNRIQQSGVHVIAHGRNITCSAVMNAHVFREDDYVCVISTR